MKNYRFTGPPAPASLAPVDPVVSELRQIQDTVLSILRKTDFAKDYEDALIAAEQATANAQLIGVINERLEAAKQAKTIAAEANPNPSMPVYFIAFRDRTVETAVSYWTDGLMLHYITPHGSHVQVRLDLVDRDLSVRMNQLQGLQVILPE